MRIKLFIGLMMLWIASGNAQNSVTTNEIVQTKDNLFGVQSKSGELLIDSIYGEIRVLYDNGKQILPLRASGQTPNPLEFYIVRNRNNQQAIFDCHGKKVFGFIDCLGIQFDPHTQTVSTSEMLEDNRIRSTLYSINGQKMFDRTFENIAYINNSDLIALIAEDGRHDEYYLFNPFTKIKLGPFDHFNIYNENSHPPLGMAEEDFAKYKGLNLITIRTTKENDYIWGVVDLRGVEILPMEYKYFRVIENSMKSTYIAKSAKPENVDFIFYSRKTTDESKLIFLDDLMNTYEFVRLEDYKSAIRKIE